jgi:hypothetical protein
MHPDLRKSLATKCAAVGFIAIILLGNYWMMLHITSSEIPALFYDVFLCVAAWVILSGVAMLITLFRNNFYRN